MLVLADQTFVQAPGGPEINTDAHISLGRSGITARQIAFKINSSYSTDLVNDPYVGLSEVQIYIMPMPELPGSAITVTANGVPAFQIPNTVSGYQYSLVYKNNLTDASWIPLTGSGTAPGNDGTLNLSDPSSPLPSHRFYRLEVANP